MYPTTSLFSMFDGIDNGGAQWATRIIALVIVWFIVWLLVRYLSRGIRLLDAQSKHLDISARDLKTIDRLSDYVIVLIGMIISLAVLGWSELLYSALTAAGVFTIMVGFAVKDVAANFISGIFILIDQPFAPGDYVQIGSHAGTVKTVSLRSTTLVTIDGPVIFIPNSIVAVEPTLNYSLAEDRRISFKVSIANDANVGQALKIIEHVLADDEDLLAERTQLVLVNEVREYAVDIAVSCYAPKDTFFTLASDLKQRVMNALQQDGIELAVPVRKNVYPGLPTALTQAVDQE